MEVIIIKKYIAILMLITLTLSGCHPRTVDSVVSGAVAGGLIGALVSTPSRPYRPYRPYGSYRPYRPYRPHGSYRPHRPHRPHGSISTVFYY